MNNKIVTAALAVAAVFVPLTAAGSCSAPATGDRQAPNGTRADAFGDAQNVTVYRNADNVPNVATFCLGNYGWAATLSGGDQGGDKSSALVRFPEMDEECAR